MAASGSVWGHFLLAPLKEGARVLSDFFLQRGWLAGGGSGGPRTCTHIMHEHTCVPSVCGPRCHGQRMGGHWGLRGGGL